MFGQHKTADAQRHHSRLQSRDGFEHEIFRKRSAAIPQRTLDIEAKHRAGLKAQAVTDSGESDQALEIVQAVGAAAADAERQVDLGWRQRAERSVHPPRLFSRRYRTFLFSPPRRRKPAGWASPIAALPRSSPVHRAPA